MKAVPQGRTLTTEEKLIQSEYKLKQFTTLLALVAKDIGMDKVIEIGKSDDYPKNEDQIKAMIEQGKRLRDLQRYELWPELKHTTLLIDEEKYKDGDWVKWEDIEKIIG